MTSEIVRRRVRVRGRVQGVFFRERLRRLAERRAVAGWASNRPDGSLEALFEGQADAVQELLAFCHEGPPHARVETVEIAEETPEGLAGFRIG
jgi:acylphosphatase